MSTTINHQIRSSYTDDQLRDALITATELRERIFIRGTVGADGAYGSQHWSEDQIADLHTILNVLEALAEDNTDAGEDAQHGVLQAASDEWEPAGFDDIKETDQAVLAMHINGTGIQGTVTACHPNTIWLGFAGQAFDLSRSAVEQGRISLYRIPAPIIHPDPEDHPLILVYEFDGKPAPAGSYASICQNMHGDPIYEYVPSDGSQTMATTGAGITLWEPATVVPKTEAEHDG